MSDAPTYSVISYPSRDLPTNYIALVYSKWLRSLRFGNPLFKNIESDAFYREYHKYIESLLEKPLSVIRLAVLSDDHDVVLGFSVSREAIIDYVHVHMDHRRVGVGRSLLPAHTTTMTHITMTSLTIWRNNPKYEHLIFNPFA